MSNNVGRASIEIGADARGFSSGLRSQVQPALNNMVNQAKSSADSMARNMGNSLAQVIPRVQDIGRHLQNLGPRISGVGDSLTRSITVPALGAATAAAGITAALGWSRLKSLDTAKGQLKGLGYSTEDVNRITGQLSKDLEGGMMTLGQATSAAANGMAAGVSEGKELTRYIQLMDAAIVGGSGTFDEFNQIFAQTADLGHLTSTNFDIVAARMPGFSSAMQEHTGLSGQAFRDMLNAGEITMDEFLNVMDSFAGDMATEYAKTWEGMVQNTKAWIGILGENLLGGVFEQSKESLAEFIEFLSSDEVMAWAADVGESIGNAFTKVVQWVQSAIEWFIGLDSSTQKLIGAFALFAVSLGPILAIGGRVLTLVGRLITSPLGVTFTRWATQAASIIGAQGLGGIATIAGKVIGIFGRFLPVVGWIAAIGTALVAVWNHSEMFREAVGRLWETVVEAFSGILAKVGELFGAFGRLGALFTGDGPVGMIASFLMDVLALAFTGLVTVVGWVVENIGGFITGLLDVIIGFVNLVTAVFSGDWAAAWEAVKQIVTGALTAVWNFLQLMLWGRIIKLFSGFGGLLRGVWSSVWNWVRSFVTTAINGVRSVITSVLNAVRSFISTILNAIRNIFSSVWNGIRSLVTSVINGIRNVITSVFNAIRSIITSILNGIRSTVSNIFNGIRNVISSVMNGIRSVISSMWNGIRNVFRSALSAIQNSVRSGFNNVVGFIRGIPGKVLGALGNLGSLLTGAGRSLINGFLGGIRNAWGRVTSFVRNGLTNLRNLLPFSPAKEGPFSGKGYTLYSGQALIGDFAKGIKDQEADLARQMSQVAESAQGAFNVNPTVPDISAGKLLDAHAGVLNLGTPKPPRSYTDADRDAAAAREAEYGGGDLIQVIVPRGGDRVAVLQGLESGRFRSRTRRR